VSQKPKEPDSVKATGTDQERMLFCVLHHPMDAETHRHTTWRIEIGEKYRGVEVVGIQKPAHHHELHPSQIRTGFLACPKS